MADPVRTDNARAADIESGPDRDARVEHLLLQGLDHYFAGRYDQAIHVWTRVLFLDRSHLRARAYIERARCALAERQRHSDELLHRGTAAFEQGEAHTARRLLIAAVEQGAPSDVALAYLDRLDRLDIAVRGGDTAPAAPRVETVPQDEIAVADRRGPLLVVLLLASAAALVALAWIAGSLLDLSAWSPGAQPAAASFAPMATEAVPVPRASDVALARARALFGNGRAQDAMRLLSTISIADPNRGDADRLLADIQRTLLSTGDIAHADRAVPTP